MPLCAIELTSVKKCNFHQAKNLRQVFKRSPMGNPCRGVHSCPKSNHYQYIRNAETDQPPKQTPFPPFSLFRIEKLESGQMRPPARQHEDCTVRKVGNRPRRGLGNPCGLVSRSFAWYIDGMEKPIENHPEDHSTGSESYQVVARRYRPQVFAELVGQSHVAQALSNAMATGRVGHAYLFTGARGVGKTSSARIFAKSLNCVDGPTITPCGVCDSCRNVSIGEDIDVLEIDGASNRGIDEIRQLRQNASICPSRSRFKIYIID